MGGPVLCTSCFTMLVLLNSPSGVANTSLYCVNSSSSCFFSAEAKSVDVRSTSGDKGAISVVVAVVNPVLSIRQMIPVGDISKFSALVNLHRRWASVGDL